MFHETITIGLRDQRMGSGVDFQTSAEPGGFGQATPRAFSVLKCALRIPRPGAVAAPQKYNPCLTY